MCFVLQTLLFVAAAAVMALLHRVFDAPLWLCGIGGGLTLIAAWIGYQVYQARHPDWWPPWDEGLPRQMRMTNAFVPVWMALALLFVLFPVVQTARERAQAITEKRARRTEQRRKQESYLPVPKKLP